MLIPFTVLLFDHSLTFTNEVSIHSKLLMSLKYIMRPSEPAQIEHIWRKRMTPCEAYFIYKVHESILNII